MGVIAIFSRVQALADGVVKRFAIERGFNGFVEDFPGEVGTFTTLGGQPESFADLAKMRRTRFDSLPNLVVGNSFAQAYVHGGSLAAIDLGLIGRCSITCKDSNFNENHCQYH